METQISISDFFVEKINTNLNLFEFYAKEDREKVLNLILQNIDTQYQAIIQKTKNDIFAINEKLGGPVNEEIQFLLFDKNIFTYVKIMVEKSKFDI
jgi:hypothetical protein